MFRWNLLLKTNIACLTKQIHGILIFLPTLALVTMPMNWALFISASWEEHNFIIIKYPYQRMGHLPSCSFPSPPLKVTVAAFGIQDVTGSILRGIPRMNLPGERCQRTVAYLLKSQWILQVSKSLKELHLGFWLFWKRLRVFWEVKLPTHRKWVTFGF